MIWSPNSMDSWEMPFPSNQDLYRSSVLMCLGQKFRSLLNVSLLVWKPPLNGAVDLLCCFLLDPNQPKTSLYPGASVQHKYHLQLPHFHVAFVTHKMFPAFYVPRTFVPVGLSKYFACEGILASSVAVRLFWMKQKAWLFSMRTVFGHVLGF